MASKAKKKSSNSKVKALIVLLLGLGVLCLTILWSSLFKAYPIDGKKQLLAINQGDTYSGFIDQLAQDDKINW
jgi:UPF0755 protein